MNSIAKLILLFYCLLFLAVQVSLNLIANEKAKIKPANEPFNTKANSIVSSDNKLHCFVRFNP
jgi:hypothetical protein